MRREHLTILDRSPGWPTEQFFIALVVLSMFAWAYARSSDDATMRGALIAGFAGAWGYFLGSSAGAKGSAARTDGALAIAQQAMDKLPDKNPSTILKPGETAQAELPADLGEDGAGTETGAEPQKR